MEQHKIYRPKGRIYQLFITTVIQYTPVLEGEDGGKEISQQQRQKGCQSKPSVESCLFIISLRTGQAEGHQ